MSKENDDLKKKVADSTPTISSSGLTITDLENRIWNLEADVMVKERIILEKNEVKILWEKINTLGKKEENATTQVMNMDIDNKVQKKKKRPNRKRRQAQAQDNRNGKINELKLEAIGDSKILPKGHVILHFMIFLVIEVMLKFTSY